MQYQNPPPHSAPMFSYQGNPPQNIPQNLQNIQSPISNPSQPQQPVSNENLLNQLNSTNIQTMMQMMIQNWKDLQGKEGSAKPNPE